MHFRKKILLFSVFFPQVAHYDRLKRPIEGMQMDPVERKFIEGIIKVNVRKKKKKDW